MAATLTAPVAERASAPPRRPEPPSRRRPVSTSTLVAWTVSVVGLVLLAFVGFVLVGSNVQASRAQDVLYKKLTDQLSAATAPVEGVIQPGTPIGILQIPRLHVQQVLVQGSSSEQTVNGPGLKSDSAFPGETGSSVVVGRRATFGAPFADLGTLDVGDELVVTTGLGKKIFVVDLVRHTDDPAQKVKVVGSRLTLVTSDPALTPTRQIVVSAALVGTPTPTSTTAVVRDGEAPGAHVLDRAVLVLLWTQLLLVVAWATTRLGLRYDKRAVWIGAVPVLLAVLWNIFEGVAVLLPNTL